MSVTYTATLPVREETVRYLTGLLTAERLRRGTRSRRRSLSCHDQAVLVLRWFLDSTRVKQLARDNQISNSTAYDYLHEGIDVLAQQAPSLRSALLAAKAAGYSHVSIDGTLIETDRVATPGPTKGVDLWWSGKHRHHGGNIQVITVPDGWPIWTSQVRLTSMVCGCGCPRPAAQSTRCPTHQALIMLLGAQSNREIQRSRFRTMAAMRAQVREQGRYLCGRPLYGYRLVDAGPHTPTRPTPGGVAGCNDWKPTHSPPHTCGGTLLRGWPDRAWPASKRLAHTPLISQSDYVAAQAMRTNPTPAAGTIRTFLLAGLLRCRRCGRRMESHWVHGRPGYRCRHGHTSAKPATATRPKPCTCARTIYSPACAPVSARPAVTSRPSATTPKTWRRDLSITVGRPLA